MVNLLRLALASLRNRRVTAVLTVLAIAVSVAVILGVQHIRTEARASFGKTVSGVDLVVGARTGPLNLLLYSVFRMGGASNHLSWESYQTLKSDPRVAWTIPISLGDSVRGHPVMGTTTDYFRHFRFGQGRMLEWHEGRSFGDGLETVLGAVVARKLGYGLGDEIVMSHGLGHTSFSHHDHHPFVVVGVLRPTGTPVDHTVHVSLESIEAIHHDWPGGEGGGAQHADHDLLPSSITAFLVGLESRLATFEFQRYVNDYPDEPLTAILPGVALTELWQVMGILENVLALIALLVLVAALLGMVAMLLASMRERQREIAVLRAIGAPATALLFLIQLEAILITVAGMVLGALILWAGLSLSQAWVAGHYGLYLQTHIFTLSTLRYLALILVGSIVLAMVPAWHAYRRALYQSLS